MTLSAPESTPGISIDVVVPIYNKRRLLEQAVGSIVGAVSLYSSAKLWLVDNGSTDGSYELLLDRFTTHATIMQLRDGTISAVRNLGARQGSAPVLSFLDCDCLVPPDYFSRLDAVFAKGTMDATGCKVALPPRPTWVEATWNRMHDEGNDGPREWINSGNFAIRRLAFERVGGFDEDLETGEDAELCQRLRGAGGTIIQDRRLAVAHLDNAKTLAAFFRKERWRGLGMFATLSGGSIDKPVAMTAVHLAALTAACVLAFSGMPLWAKPLVMVVLGFAIPSATVCYRLARSAHPFRVDQGLILYELYYLARIHAAATVAWRKLRSSRATAARS